MSKAKQNGFTLIELLVVVSIIALLVSILLPALGKARAQARKIVCSTHLNQIGRGMSMYLTEENGRYPLESNAMWWKADGTPYEQGHPRWWLAVKQYIDPEFTQPSSTAGIETVGHCPDHKPNQDEPQTGYSYRANSYLVRTVNLSNSNSPRPSRLNADVVQQPSEKILTFEVFTHCQIPLSGTNAPGWGRPKIPYTSAYDKWSHNLDTHGNESNLLFADSHVGAHPLDTMTNHDKNWKASK